MNDPDMIMMRIEKEARMKEFGMTGGGREVAQTDRPGYPQVKDTIKARIAEHEKQLVKLRELDALLDKNPDFERLLNLTREVI